MKKPKKEASSADIARRWLSELQLSKKQDEKFITKGRKIVRRYRDDRGTDGFDYIQKRFNILWSNVQTMLPALYGRTPRAQVERRYKDQDPVGRTAAQILERALQYEIDHYGDFDASNKAAVLDRLLPGRGVVWVRFETKEVEGPEVTESEGEEAMEPSEEYECTPTDYVYWEDFRCSPARCWDEVTWVARRVYMTRDDLVKRFGEEAKDVPLTHEPIGLNELENQGASQGEIDAQKKAQVWEIWSKPEKMVYWVAEEYSRILDKKDDPYGLDNFWPCPRPLFATQTTDTIVPVADYLLYQDQADELDRVTGRIGQLVEACKVVGIYDSSQAAVQRMLSEGTNNTMIPCDTWAAFGEKGGMKGVVDWLPLDMVLKALNEMYMAREQTKQVIYEITGLSDIIRGASIASETATAQQIKSQYASLRLKRLQNDVAMFTSEILRIKAQLMADLYRPEVLIQMSGIMGTEDAQYAQDAVMLLKQEPSRSFRIEVATDSLVEMDEQAEKQSRVEFLQAAGGFMQQALPVVQASPAMGPLVAEMLLFGVRAFKAGRPLENAFDTAMAQMQQPQEQKPDPEMAKVEAQTQAEQAKLQGQAMIEQFKQQQETQREQMRIAAQQEMEAIKQQGETSRAEMKARIDAETKLTIAGMTAEAAKKPAAMVQVDAGNAIETMGQDFKAMAEQSSGQMAQAMEQVGQGMAMLAQVLESINRPKRRVLERGPDGRAIGMIEVSE